MRLRQRGDMQAAKHKDAVRQSEMADGRVAGYSSNYPTARSDSDSYDVAAATLAVGQNLDSGTYACYRLFFSFDTSGVDDAHDVVSAAFYAKASIDMSDTDFLLQLYRYSWSEPLGSYQEANYDGACNGSATLEGTFRNTADGWSDGTYCGRAVATSGINKSGDTKYTLWTFHPCCTLRHMVLQSSTRVRHRSGE